MDLRRDARAIFQAGLDAVDPRRAVARALTLAQNRLEIRQGRRRLATVDLDSTRRVFLVGAGKATAPMALAVEEILGSRLTSGIISVKAGHGLPLSRTRVHEAGHPMPDLAGQSAAEEIKELVTGFGSGDLVLALFSGGGSALLPLPAPGLTLEQKQEVTGLLLASGANIQEINAVRKHLSQIKGGHMARLAAPARVVNLLLSDVVGDDLDAIASGPFVPDGSTFADVAAILERYGLMNRIPDQARTRVEQGLAGLISETPKPGAPEFRRVTHAVVGSNFLALSAAARAARALGYHPLILSSTIEGETREVARVHGALAREVRRSGHPIRPPACLISGGETTVTLRGPGRGGRNQEFALAACLEIAGLRDVLIFSAGTDGTDGPTDAAGAQADGRTAARAGALGLDPRAHLDANDSYPFFQPLNDLVITGPTRTNVMDIRLILLN